jgi:hypothetical protein
MLGRRLLAVDETPSAPTGEQIAAVTREAQKAWNAVLVTAASVKPPDTDDVRFSHIGGPVNAFLRHWSPPDDDRRFRDALEQVLGWPNGELPAGLIDSNEIWFKINFTTWDGHAPEWCRWLVQRGWAIAEEYGGCWMALPEDCAFEFRELGMELSGTAAMQTWRAWTNHKETKPSADFLREHFGS